MGALLSSTTPLSKLLRNSGSKFNVTPLHFIICTVRVCIQMLLVNIKEAIFFRNNIFKEVNMNYLANFHEHLKKIVEVEKLFENLSKENIKLELIFEQLV